MLIELLQAIETTLEKQLQTHHPREISEPRVRILLGNISFLADTLWYESKGHQIKLAEEDWELESRRHNNGIHI